MYDEVGMLSLARLISISNVQVNVQVLRWLMPNLIFRFLYRRFFFFFFFLANFFLRLFLIVATFFFVIFPFTAFLSFFFTVLAGFCGTFPPGVGGPLQSFVHSLLHSFLTLDFLHCSRP